MTMAKHICIHGHFYQPPRENPWLEEVELQDSAYPYHDWNRRVTAECYAPNSASRILDPDGKIIDIVNNYSRISFNFGPTLLSWMEEAEPEVYEAILEADRLGMERYSGHGPAMAQVHNHLIMPLANKRDKRTQVKWGIADFKKRFGRDPEGMWLAETAVDLDTLDIMAEHGIRFTILAPRQAKAVKAPDGDEWEDVSGDRIDPSRPYLCRLPSGRTMALFFYDGMISKEIAFQDLLTSGEKFAGRLLEAFPEDGTENGDEDKEEDHLVHIATDGETYGHHRKHGDMALAYCMHHIESNGLARLTIYPEYLDEHPPAYEVEIFEDSSWSCIHGVQRWRADCGCNTGMHGGWTQDWRAPLRGAMDWLSESLAKIYEDTGGELFEDPWKARDEFIRVIMDRSENSVWGFLQEHAHKSFSHEDRVRALKLLEMQRHAMLMYTSCGWFFDELSGIETVQVIHYAARAMQLAKDLTGIDLEPSYIKLLERAPSNVPENENGGTIYEKFVKPAVLDLDRVGAHYAISSLFEDYPEETGIYCFTARKDEYERLEMGQQKLATGVASIKSNITLEQAKICFAVLHIGGHNMIGSGNRCESDGEFDEVSAKLEESFQRSNIAEVISLIDEKFGSYRYSPWYLFKDKQREVMNQVVESSLMDIENSLRGIYDRHYPVILALSEMNIPVPRALAMTSEFVINLDLLKALREDPIDMDKLSRVVDEVNNRSADIDASTASYLAHGKVSELMERLLEYPSDLETIKEATHLLDVLVKLPVSLDLWRAQNIYLSIMKREQEKMKERAEKGDPSAASWLERFDRLGSHLRQATT